MGGNPESVMVYLQNYKHSLNFLELTGWNIWGKKWCNKSLAKLARLRFLNIFFGYFRIDDVFENEIDVSVHIGSITKNAEQYGVTFFYREIPTIYSARTPCFCVRAPHVIPREDTTFLIAGTHVSLYPKCKGRKHLTRGIEQLASYVWTKKKLRIGNVCVSDLLIFFSYVFPQIENKKAA